MKNIERLINKLVKLPKETEWVEFKHNNSDPKTIGKNISALANAAALKDKEFAYIVWGIADENHEIIGTDFNFKLAKKGNEELENWLTTLLSDNVHLDYEDVVLDGKRVVVLKISKAVLFPVKFEGIAYIKIGTYTKKLKDHPSAEGKLWNQINSNPIEEQICRDNLELNDVLKTIDYYSYFKLNNLLVPNNELDIIHYLEEDRVVVKQDDGLYSITNLGAILFAENLNDFDRLSRKSLRVVKYDGNNKMFINRNYICEKGYASSFEQVMEYIKALIPTQEIIIDALRETKNAYPILAIREIVANALIHQDFSIGGTGPVIEIFDNRIEVTNPGEPLVEIYRIVDNPPRSRNEKIAALMRRLGICEELGSGWDKIVNSCELSQLPAPRIDIYETNTKVTMFSEISFTNLSTEDKLWACYLHACIKYLQGEQLTNSSLRERFGLKNSSMASISRLIKEAVENDLIKPLNPNTAPKYMKYVPKWA